ncbi:mannose-1-phosphate guanylyltransferase [Thermosulfuriphilus sp.]
MEGYAVIMAGGKGTRFWPRSRRGLPKQLLPIVGSRSMLRQTIDRLLPLFPPERILLITGVDLAEAVRAEASEIPSENFLIEPLPRSTAACAGWAAVHILNHCGDLPMALLPSDHLIEKEGIFREILTKALLLAQETDFLVTLGIKPTRPETGYGYIEMGGALEKEGAFRVQAFKEKPDRQTAEAYLSTGNFLWNSGMFVWRPSVIMEAIRNLMPALYQELMAIKRAYQSPDFESLLKTAFSAMPSQSIDYGIMEKASNVAVIPADIGWNDLGSWEALYEISAKDEDGNVLSPGIVARGVRDSLIQVSSGQIVAAIGIEGMVVVVEGDAILICPRERLQEVRGVVKELEKRGLKEFL